MKEPIQKTEHGVTVTHIEPIDERIVKLAVSVRVPEYPSTHSETLLEAYAALLRAGTKKYSKESLDTYLKQHGIKLSIRSAKGYIHFSLTVRKAKLPEAVRMLRTLIEEPALPSDALTRYIKKALEENREAHDDAKALAMQQFTALLYAKESPLHIQSLTEEKVALKKFTISKLKALTPVLKRGEWFISIVADSISLNYINPLIQSLQKTATLVQNASFTSDNKSCVQHFTTIQSKTNVELRIGSTLPIAQIHEDYVPLMFGLDVLGKVGGFSGRLMATVREMEGLTYGIYLTDIASHNTVPGFWMIYTFFTAKDLRQGIISSKRELQKIVDSGITDQELEVFKIISTNAYLLAHESNSRRLSFYHQTAVMGYTPSQIKKRVERIESLTKTDVNKALRAYIDPYKLVISGAGPVDVNGNGILK